MFLYHSNFFASGLALSCLVGNAVATNVQSATTFAEEYGLPLMAYKSLAEPLLVSPGVNALYRSTTLSTPDSTEVVLPNVDTLYGSVLIDLAKDDLNITIPEIGDDRYYSFSFYDPYGSNYVAIGSTTNTKAGNYLLRRASDAKVPWGYSPQHSYGYRGFINSPTTQGSLLVRILVKNNSTDLDVVRSLLKAVKVNPVARSDSPGGCATPLTKSTFKNLGSSNGTSVLRLLSRLNADNPPFNVTSPARIQQKLALAGIQEDKYVRPEGADPDAAFKTALSHVKAYAGGPGLAELNNGWAHATPQGLYGNNFVARAVAAAEVYLMLLDTQAFYPTWVQSEGSQSLKQGQAYVYTFSGKPPLGPQGFWSLTMYNIQGFLVENPLDVYSVGDRSNLTYSDGVEVYGKKGLKRDESFQVLVQRADEKPPANWTSNWLPAPSGESSFSITLRLYDPTDDVKDATWQYPVVKKTTAITA